MTWKEPLSRGVVWHEKRSAHVTSAKIFLLESLLQVSTSISSISTSSLLMDFQLPPSSSYLLLSPPLLLSGPPILLPILHQGIWGAFNRSKRDFATLFKPHQGRRGGNIQQVKLTKHSNGWALSNSSLIHANGEFESLSLKLMAANFDTCKQWIKFWKLSLRCHL